ncbi:hypothetical protein BKA61DRAFT_496228 [Leptodontidium sp. MPI-SDFR-AT-0119]|nr:hypothetical protein BKA61DRAFT_496228 [Leptodontidium sp. MPI-SDFR-AT-0119]
MEVFTHKPLDLKRDQIRLLKVERGASDAIRCSVKAYDPRDCTPYEAVSYVWGSEHPVRSIILDERIFEIRENLWQFLRNIQHKIISCY